MNEPPRTLSGRGAIYVLTGERGAGKSVVCARVVEKARELGHSVAGLLTERADATAAAGTQGAGGGPQCTESRVVVDLSTGERFPFGSRGGPAAADSQTDYMLPGWRLDVGAFAEGNRVLAAATPCDLLIVDEVGPLELLGGRGWTQAFVALGSRDFRAALLVCRSGLVEELVRRLNDRSVKVLEVDRKSRDALPAAIVEELLD